MKNEQAEPAGYFVNDESDDQWHQVDYEQRNGADTYPLYLHPPAAEVQQAEPAGEVARIGCHYAMLPDHVCNKCGRIHGYSHPHAAYLRGVDEGKRQAAAPQQVEPVAWMAFGGSIVHAVTRNAMDPIEAERFDVPLYLHQPAAEVQRLRDALKPFAAIDLTTNQAVNAMDVLRARRALKGK